MESDLLLELYELQPDSFWRFSDGGTFAFEFSVAGKNLVLIELIGEVHHDGFGELRKRVEWAMPKLKATGFSEKIQCIIDCSRLAFIGIDTRQEIFELLDRADSVSHAWVFSQSRWTQSYWRVIALLSNSVKLELVKDYQEALQKALETPQETLTDSEVVLKNFDLHWRNALNTRYFDRYLFKYVTADEWSFELENPYFKAEFLWVEGGVLYVELIGRMTYHYAARVLNTKLKVLNFLKSNGLSSINLILNISALTSTSFRSLELLRLYLAKVPITVNRYIVGSSFVEKIKLGRLMSWFSPDLSIKSFSDSLAHTIRLAKDFNTISKNIDSQKELDPERYYHYLKKKQKSIYKNDERFRRRLFSHLSHLIVERDSSVPFAKYTNAYLGNEIFHTLELLAADFKQTYSKLEQENVAIQQVKAQALQQQINPHFIFNALNSILAHVYSENIEIAEGLLTNFAHLMRMVIENAPSGKVSLAAELDFLDKYIEMEQIRSNNEISIVMNIAPELRSKSYILQISPMIIQPYIEIAIWHRLMPKADDRMLEIKFEKNISYLKCTIEDNGIGLEEAARMRAQKKDPGGTQIVEDRIDLLNKLSNLPVRTETMDLLGADAVAGTRVILHLPLNEIRKA